MTYIGIDVSKDSFVAAYPAKSGYTTKSFQNTASGVHKFISSLPNECHCVMEATGNYSMLLLYLLQEKGIPASMENPQKRSRQRRLLLRKPKKRNNSTYFWQKDRDVRLSVSIVFVPMKLLIYFH